MSLPPVPRVPTLDREPILKRWLSELRDLLLLTIATLTAHIEDVTIHFVKEAIMPTVEVDSDYAPSVGNRSIIVDASSNTVTVTLPDAPTSGEMKNISCIDSTFACTIDFNGILFYDSSDDEFLFKGENVTLQFDGTRWISA